jgi:hypothetical protein
MMEKISVKEEEEGGLPACLQLASTTDHKTVIKFRLLALICPVLPLCKYSNKTPTTSWSTQADFFFWFYWGLYIAKKRN